MASSMPNIKRQLDFMEAELAGRPWFAGNEFSAADVQMSFPLEVAAVRGGLGAQYPRLVDFLARIHARPAYQRHSSAAARTASCVRPLLQRERPLAHPEFLVPT